MDLKLRVLYFFFAVIATALNLLFQDITYQLFLFEHKLLVSMFVGTLAGLIAKYILDKRYIFKYVTQNKVEDTKLFILYSTMGIITTFIFWIVEFMFDYYFQTREMRYLGAVLGLSIGYLTKYSLDKKFVFRTKNEKAD
ncbi:GtrA family protein [Pseudoalteromonas spongiae]|uniref:GtrA family protein n=1 Tax=Pseudoalteromonas spongiae TaxID=298657 RepID=UPI00110AB0B6|nr:GtrA family protein [Pseudoalteromonas spongiae]TMO83721.1 hypothetical protein CWC15_13560 [Pseudoalteromonas spongiae]